MSLPWLGFSILASDLHSWSKPLKIVQNVIILDSDSDSDNDSVASTQIDANVNSGAPEAELMNTLGLNLHNLPIADSMTQYLVHDETFGMLEMSETHEAEMAERQAMHLQHAGYIARVRKEDCTAETNRF